MAILSLRHYLSGHGEGRAAHESIVLRRLEFPLRSLLARVVVLEAGESWFERTRFSRN
ncbi:hypothetical protein HALLA_16740 [Halostagnicola larsenii XH-48]|uniref:Uncharacterized protein n=1 Tax=Halostagnicola larsenii XH-48 TaxID=797299 RepID=W0JUS7_9EURY|nr:hypothetical protein HALLA_16740 [Halostagnicola larsenii XH-48]